MKPLFIVTAAFIAIQISFSSCSSSIKDDKLQTWFYGVPIYKNVSEIRGKLTSDPHFIQQQSSDTTKDWYTYRGTIKQPYLPTGIEVSDSSVIDFSYFDFGGSQQNGTKGLSSTVKLLRIEY